MLPPLNTWLIVFDRYGPRCSQAMMFKSAGASYKIVRSSGQAVPGTVKLIDMGDGFAIGNGHSQTKPLGWRQAERFETAHQP